MRAAARSSLPAAYGAAAGIVFAAWLYGSAVIAPRSVAWLLHGDPAQHFIGLTYFLNQAWHWPPGLIHGFGDPTSVVFTDSIPLLAFMAKVLGPEGRWQYFGIWIVACHALAGWFGARLLQRFGAGGAAAAIGSLFFIVSPAILLRAYGHESLMAQFLVIAALERALRPQWRAGGWLLLAVVAVLVHAYLAVMVILLGVAAALAAAMNRSEPVPRLLLQAAGASGVLLAAAWAAGYFVGEGDYVAAGYGHFSANLLTWFDPMDWAAFNRFWGREVPYAREWSRFLPALGQATSGQYEGFAYLGAGMLLLVAVAAVGAMRKRAMPAHPNMRWVAGACVTMLLLAVSTRPTIGSATLVHVPLPESLENLLGAFRAGGRFVWPLTYLLMAWAISRAAALPAAALVLVVAFVLQGADLSPKLKEFRTRFRQPPAEAPQAASSQWGALLSRCPRIEMVSAAHPGQGWIEPALAAAEAGAAFTPAPTARYSQKLEAQRQAHVESLLRTGSWRPGTIYLLAPPLPAGATPAGVAVALPPAMRHRKLGPSDVVFDARCAAP